jgi:uncharacterized protein
VAICTTCFDDVCRGCGRTVAEVAEWVIYTSEEKEIIWQRIEKEGYPKEQK